MRNFIIVFITVLISINCFSQNTSSKKKQPLQLVKNQPSIAETKAFIKKYIEMFPANNGGLLDANHIQFKEGNDLGLMVYESEDDDGNNELRSMGIDLHVVFSYIFAIKDIESIIVDMNIMKGVNCQLIVNLSSNGYGYMKTNGTNEISKKVNKIIILLGSSSFSENYPERIKIAFEHLVKLSGGNIIEDKF
jgi:hypothetical protein